MIRARFTPAVAAPSGVTMPRVWPSTRRSHRRNMQHANVTQNEVPENSKRALKNEGEGPPACYAIYTYTLYVSCV